MAILLVRVESFEGKVEEAYLDLDHVRTTNSLLQHVQQLGWNLLPGASQIQATYLDDEGDKCTLTEQTSKDALSFAAPHEGIDDTVILTVSVHGEWAEEPCVESQTQTSITTEAPATMEEAPVIDVEEGIGRPGTPTCESQLLPDQLDPVAKFADPPSVQEVEKLMEAPPVIRRVFQRDSAKATLAQCRVMQESCITLNQCLQQDGEQLMPSVDIPQVVADGLQQTLPQEQCAGKEAEDAQSKAEELAACLEEERNARKESDEAKLRAEERANALQQTLEEEHSARVEAEDAKLQADGLAHGLQRSLEEEHNAREESEEAKLRAEDLANAVQQTLLEEQTAHALQLKLLDGTFQESQQSLVLSLDVERSANKVAGEEKIRMEELVNALQQKLEEEQFARKEAQDAKMQADEAADTWMRSAEACKISLQEKTNAHEHGSAMCAKAYEAQLCAEELVTTLQQTLEEETLARKESEKAALLAQELETELRICMAELAEEQAARNEMTDAKHEQEQAHELAETSLALCRQNLEECEKAKLHAESQLVAKADELQQSLADSLAAKAIADSLADKADELQQSLADEQAARQEAEVAKLKADEAKLKAVQEAAGEKDRSAKEMSALRAEICEHVREAHVLRERAAQAEKLLHDMQNAKAATPSYSASVHTIEDSPLTLGIEAEEDVSARGDVTKEFAELVSTCGVRQAFRIGRIRLPATFSDVAPACARVAVKNDGGYRWPQTTVIVNVEGDNFGLQVLALGILEPGEVKEIEMDLEVHSKNEASSHSQKRLYRPRHTMPQLAPRFVAGEARSETRSLWAIVDAATGCRLGPLLIFEAVWDLP